MQRNSNKIDAPSSVVLGAALAKAVNSLRDSFSVSVGKNDDTLVHFDAWNDAIVTQNLSVRLARLVLFK